MIKRLLAILLVVSLCVAAIPTVTAVSVGIEICGDVNGDKVVTIADAVSVYYYVNGRVVLTGTAKTLANVAGNDAKTTIADAVAIYYYVNGVSDGTSSTVGELDAARSSEVIDAVGGNALPFETVISGGAADSEIAVENADAYLIRSYNELKAVYLRDFAATYDYTAQYSEADFEQNTFILVRVFSDAVPETLTVQSVYKEGTQLNIHIVKEYGEVVDKTPYQHTFMLRTASESVSDTTWSNIYVETQSVGMAQTLPVDITRDDVSGTEVIPFAVGYNDNITAYHHTNVYIVRSAQELQALCLLEGDGNSEWQEQYTQEYFDTNALVVMYVELGYMPAGDLIHEVTALEKDGTTLVLHMLEHTRAGADNGSTHVAVLETTREDVADIETATIRYYKEG